MYHSSEDASHPVTSLFCPWTSALVCAMRLSVDCWYACADSERVIWERSDRRLAFLASAGDGEEVSVTPATSAPARPESTPRRDAADAAGIFTTSRAASAPEPEDDDAEATVPLFRRGLEAAAVDPAVASAGVRAMEANMAFVCDVRGRLGA